MILMPHRSRLRFFVLFGLPLLVWMAVIYHFSSEPYSKQNLRPWLKQEFSDKRINQLFSESKIQYNGKEVSIRKSGTWGFVEFFIRKAAHLFVYGVLAILIARLLHRGLGQRKLAVYVTVILASALFAGLDEFHQSFVSQRTAAIEDVILDTCGALLGTAMYYFFLKILQKSRKNAPNYPKTS